MRPVITPGPAVATRHVCTWDDRRRWRVRFNAHLPPFRPGRVDYAGGGVAFLLRCPDLRVFRARLLSIEPAPRRIRYRAGALLGAPYRQGMVPAKQDAWFAANDPDGWAAL